MIFNNKGAMHVSVFLVAILLAACGGGSASDANAISKTWGAATLIETGAYDAYTPHIAMDTSGNALAVWEQNDNFARSTYSNRYTAASGIWGSAATIETGDVYPASLPQIAADANGNALAVWQQSDGVRNSIYANRYSAASGVWGAATLIETDDTGVASDPQIAMNANGNALAVWVQDDGLNDSIYANRYSAASGVWDSATLLESDDVNVAADPQIAIDANGNALAVWSQTDGVHVHTWANRYTNGVGWDTAAPLEASAGDVNRPQIAIDANGNALAVWEQSDGVRNNVWATRYTATTHSWGTAVLVETDVGNAGAPQLAFDAGGNALAVWEQYDGTRFNIWSNRYTAASNTWGTALLIETDTGDANNSPQIAIDGNGNGLAVWSQSDGTRNNIWANRYISSSNTWGTAALIETDNTGDANEPQIALNASGDACAVWTQFDGSRYNIWANEYK